MSVGVLVGAAWRLALTLAVAWLAVCLLLFLMQERLVFLPNIGGRTLVATPEALGLDYEDVTFEAADGVRLHAWFVPAEDARGTVIVFHGNAGNISHRLDTLRIFHGLGLNTLLFNYRGYGQSEGRPSEAGLGLDAAAAWEEITGRRGIPAEEVILFGRSLGGTLAAQQAAATPPAALVLESTFTSVPDLAAELYRIFPVRLLARLKFDARAALAEVQAPVLVVHSRQDEIVPFSHAEALLEAAGSRAELLEIRGDHNTGFLQSGQAYRDGLAGFILPRLPAR